ncbi:hypothetical protein CHS0354_005081 [Potamilus streckersoni]|uniref:Ammonium transporter AmtB-like domain-containing protein n=1 Tax=Potamilus streckersoni TaxID=2493646 RepID=A0AAE0SI42_9BIVA|nr:hypothetical protein CHS0354_005081 [Potamilus streckersoni]
MVGGISAFIAAAALGPRIGKFDKETGRPVDIKGHSVPLAALGGFILLFGFFAFNGSSQGHISQPGDGVIVAIAIKNTALSATGGAFTALIMNKTYFGDKKWSFLTTLNGCLTGMVSICGGCNQYYSYSAFAVGIIGGVSYMIITWLTIKLKVDDPLDATAVHVGGGLWGALAVPFFSYEYGILFKWNKRSGYHLAWQLAGMASIFAWTSSLCFIMFFTLRKLGILRVSFEYEIKGLDIPKHGEAAYPAESYGHGWGEKGDALAGLVKSAVSSSVVFTNKGPINYTKPVD